MARQNKNLARNDDEAFREMLDEGDAWVATPSEVAEFWRSLEDGSDPDPDDPE